MHGHGKAKLRYFTIKTKTHTYVVAAHNADEAKKRFHASHEETIRQMKVKKK